MPQICLDGNTLSSVTRNVKRTYVRGPGSPNAVESMVRPTSVGETLVEIHTFANVVRAPSPIRKLVAEDIDAGSRFVRGTYAMKLELVLSTAYASPINISFHRQPQRSVSVRATAKSQRLFTLCAIDEKSDA